MYKNNNVVVIGAGKIGSAIIKHLTSIKAQGDYKVTVIDSYQPSLDAISDIVQETILMPITDVASLRQHLGGQAAVLSAADFTANKIIAEACLLEGCSYFDLTEDVETTAHVKELSKKIDQDAKQIFMPQCGLAPGFIGILAHSLTEQFDQIHDVRLRVGALPKNPQNIMKYNLTWSTSGLVNEYFNTGEAIIDGDLIITQPLEGLETLSIDGTDYEAFNTSGGLGYLHHTLAGKVRNLDYKTIRYPGHAEYMKFLKNDLDMGERRDLLEKIFDESVPVAEEDQVVIFASVTGLKDGKNTYVNDARIIPNGVYYNEPWTGIQITTASGICAVVDMFFEGQLPQNGFVNQEEVKLEEFLQNRFGSAYNN